MSEACNPTQSLALELFLQEIAWSLIPLVTAINVNYIELDVH